jgi:toluene monooxygenase system protein B
VQLLVFPVLSRFQYDCHVKVVEAEPAQTIDALAAECARHSVGLHVAEQPGKILRIRPTTDSDDAEPWPRDMTVAEAGLKQFECIDVYFTDSDAA